MSQSLSSERGNILVYALIGIVLIGGLTVALNQGSDGGRDPGIEQRVIKVTEVQREAGKVREAVARIVQSGKSETDIRFAHPEANNNYGDITDDPSRQVFHPNGGAAEYTTPPLGTQQEDNIAANYYGNVSLPQIGSDKADLIMVIPLVTPEFCTSINHQLGFDTTDPIPSGVGSGGCLAGSWANNFTGTFASSPNVVSGASFNRIPAPQACVACGTDYFYYYVLLAR